ncbi:MAG: hypothetical protein NC209_05485 [Alistipes sp.]|nr:hypothetical protein [Alistipes senegalensis]MCM1250577.1 hypothetical protein [Alistipes sp.]
MRKYVYLLSALFAALVWGRPASAQSLEAFKYRLTQPAASESAARVTITEYDDAAQAVALAVQNVRRPALNAYRVCIFSDNGPDARAGAAAARQLFEETFPGTPVYVFYENPYFRVTVGNCLTVEEAIILKGRVSGTFPKAFPKSEQLSLSDFRR